MGSFASEKHVQQWLKWHLLSRHNFEALRAINALEPSDFSALQRGIVSAATSLLVGLDGFQQVAPALNKLTFDEFKVQVAFVVAERGIMPLDVVKPQKHAPISPNQAVAKKTQAKLTEKASFSLSLYSLHDIHVALAELNQQFPDNVFLKNAMGVFAEIMKEAAHCNGDSPVEVSAAAAQNFSTHVQAACRRNPKEASFQHLAALVADYFPTKKQSQAR